MNQCISGRSTWPFVTHMSPKGVTRMGHFLTIIYKLIMDNILLLYGQTTMKHTVHVLITCTTNHYNKGHTTYMYTSWGVHMLYPEEIRHPDINCKKNHVILLCRGYMEDVIQPMHNAAISLRMSDLLWCCTGMYINHGTHLAKKKLNSDGHVTTIYFPILSQPQKN